MWYVNPGPPEPGSRLQHTIAARGKGQEITGEDAYFDPFMEGLRAAVEAAESQAAAGTGTPMIHRFLHAIGFPGEARDPRSRCLNLPGLYIRPQYGEARCLSATASGPAPHPGPWASPPRHYSYNMRVINDRI